MQTPHQAAPFRTKRFPVVVLCDHVRSPANIGGLFRIAESFGLEKIIFCGYQPDLKSNRLLRTSRATTQRVSNYYYTTANEALNWAENENYHLVALEITSRSISMSEFSFSQFKNICLVIGDEKSGISEEVLNRVKDTVHINMYGTNSSMNVTTATGIALYEITKQLQ